eukprot:TRINITY_DN13862_c0_g1_i1.p1 TRINITY_DN13862_c0_g1~~TRINITY_DN13862_c0_g1_i1.p1  ORF type:complete len:270 (+),score=53.36 TRINITY_DN13862_c0_g1_i1:117-926(+)
MEEYQDEESWDEDVEDIIDFGKIDSLLRLDKIKQNIEKVDGASKELIVMVGTGTYAPIHRMHIKCFEVAKKWLHENTNLHVVGGFISPTHDSYAEYKLKDGHISGHHRLEMTRLAIKDSDYLDVTAWELEKNFHSSIEGCLDWHQTILDETFPNHKISIYYLCGADLFFRFGLAGGFSPTYSVRRGFPVIAVGRPGYTPQLLKARRKPVPGQKQMCWIIPEELEDCSSTLIRNILIDESCSDEMKIEKLSVHTFESVAKYLVSTKNLSG